MCRIYPVSNAQTSGTSSPAGVHFSKRAVTCMFNALFRARKDRFVKTAGTPISGLLPQVGGDLRHKYMFNRFLGPNK
jgi:hypothetical protein